MREKARNPPQRVKATLTVLTQSSAPVVSNRMLQISRGLFFFFSVYDQWAGELRRWAPQLVVSLYPASFVSDATIEAVIDRVASSDVVLITYNDLHSLGSFVQTMAVSEQVDRWRASQAFRERLSWWRVVSDESQAVFDAGSKPAMATSWLWESNVWLTTARLAQHSGVASADVASPGHAAGQRPKRPARCVAMPLTRITFPSIGDKQSFFFSHRMLRRSRCACLRQASSRFSTATPLHPSAPSPK